MNYINNPLLANQFGGQNPFASLPQQGLLGGVYTQPTQRMGSKEAQSVYNQMAAPYAQWAAQQLQAVAPAPQQAPQMADPQQQALAQMWEWQQQQMRRAQEIHTN